MDAPQPRELPVSKAGGGNSKLPKSTDRSQSLIAGKPSLLRDGPLEKLWGGGGGGVGGEGEFSSRRNFFRYKIPLINYF